VEFDWTDDENPHASTSFDHNRGSCSLGFEKAEALADSPEAQFHPVKDPS